MKNFHLIFACAIAFAFCIIIFVSCKDKDEDNHDVTDNSDAINVLVKGVANLPNAIPTTPAQLIKQQDVVLTSNNGIEYDCSQQTYSIANNMSDMVALNPNAGTLYPGSLVQGNGVRNGILNSIGSFERSPLRINLDGFGQNRIVGSPSNATVDAAIIDMLEKNTLSTVAKVYSKKVEMHSLDQAMLEAGVDISWGGNNLSGSISKTTELEKHSLLLTFIQPYYTVSIEEPASPNDFFDKNVNLEDLKAKITQGNPLCYVSSVTYGRILFARFSSTKSFSEIEAVVSASFSNVNGNLRYNQSSSLEQIETEVMILGGNAQDAVSAAQGKMEGIVNYFLNGANFGPSSRGVPITYNIKHASDNSLIKLGKALEYSTYNCSAEKTFYINLLRFKIIEDCDNDSDGDFTYNIQIKNGDNVLLRTFDSSGTQDLGNGDSFDVSTGEFPIKITNADGNSLRLEATLTDNDVWPDWPDEVIEFNKEYFFPFDDISKSVTNVDVPAGKDGCRAVFTFTIRKKN